MPSTVQPGWPFTQASMRSQTSWCSAGSRTTPPLPTRSLPTSNCGLMSTAMAACGLVSASGAGSSTSSPMKLASQTSRSAASGTCVAVRVRALVRSSTTTRGSLRSFQANWPWPTSTA